MLPKEPTGTVVLIGSVFCSSSELERGVRALLRASLLLTDHPRYLENSERGQALRETRGGLIALRCLIERGIGEVW